MRLRSFAIMSFAIMLLLSGSPFLQPLFAQSSTENTGAGRTHNVLLITVDGLRWQEVFGGAETALVDKEAGGVKDIAATKERFLRDSAETGRETLMPFFWNVIAKNGVVIGNPDHDSRAMVTNGLNFSYPGYSEILCGYADPAIDSNAKKNNENLTVLEWVHSRPGFQNSVAAFCSWDVFPYIINETRSGIPVNSGWEPVGADTSLGLIGTPAGDRLEQLDEVSREFPRYFPEVRYDFVTFRAADEYLRAKKPRLLYVSLGETDDWAHAGRYDLYLDAAWRTDDYIRRLWNTVQSIPEYKDRTTLILTTDHGRGDNRVDWKNHGEKIERCEFIWMAVLGPDTKPKELRGSTFTQSQIASTVAAALGLDYNAEVPKAAEPLPVLE